MDTIQLSDHFNYRRLFKFAIPSILMMVFTSIYGVVDGFFVSNFAGKTAFAAVNFIMPYIMILGGVGFMIGTGGTALIGKTLGEGDHEKANRLFSMLMYLTIAGGIVIGIIGILTVEPVAKLFGADEDMLGLCGRYGRIVLCGTPLLMVQYEAQMYFVVAEKPKLGLYATLIAGCMNMILDAVLVGILKMGITGAAAATVISQVIGGGFPIIYFSSDNTSLLRLGRTTFDGRALLKTCSNGLSEFVSNISMSVVSMLYNVQLMKYAGQSGVAVYGVLMYVNMIFIAIFIGYATGTAPIVSFNYGAQNKDELKSLYNKSLKIIGVFAVLMLLAGELLARPLASIYVGYDEQLMDMTVHAFRIFSFTFMFASIPIYGSSFFTALNNGLISALISFLRTIVFQMGAVLILPLIWGIDGIWYSLIVAELIASALTIFFWIKEKDRYGYV